MSLRDVEAGGYGLVSSVSQFTRNQVGRRLKLLVGIGLLFLVFSYGSFKTAVHGAQYWKGMGVQRPFGEVEPEWVRDLVPDDPDPEDLPPGSSILPDVDVDNLAPPKYAPFPTELMNELYAGGGYPNSQDRYVGFELPEDAFAKHWKSPGWYAQAADHNAAERSRHIPRVQYDFAEGHESEERKAVREERKEAVKRGFVYAWQKYKEHAWGHDEVRPASLAVSDPFQNWGASIIDSLETLLIMGLSSEYDLCRPHVNQVDLHLVNGRDWARGHRTFDEEGRVTSETAEGRDQGALVATFETGIRYLGGLIGAYDLSGDDLMLERAIDLAKLLCRGFDTLTGLVAPRFDAGSKSAYFDLGRVSLAEVGSMTLELTRLSQITGDKWYFERAQRALDYLETDIIPRSVQRPMMPSILQVAPNYRDQIDGQFHIGGMADSYYEYLIKQHQLIGGATSQYKNMYTAAMDKAESLLFSQIGFLNSWRDYVTIGSCNNGYFTPETEHLTCFAGAMLGLGAKLLGRPKDLAFGEKFTQTCYWLGAASESGCQPEKVMWFDDNDPTKLQNITNIQSGKQIGPVIQQLRGNPAGTKWQDARYLGRPETIESVFYMYRITGDKKWQDRGWRMFKSWTESALAPGGYSSISDTRSSIHRHSDNMESFVFAETFKYHYLLQSEPDLISLDDYVFTTEAHPLITQPGLKPGSQGFWKPPHDTLAGLGIRERGSDAQLWTRLKLAQSRAQALGATKTATQGGPHQPIGMPPRPPPPGSDHRPPPIINKNPAQQDDMLHDDV